MLAAHKVLVTAAIIVGLFASSLCKPLPAGNPSSPESPHRGRSQSPQEELTFQPFGQEHHSHYYPGSSSYVPQEHPSHEHQQNLGYPDQGHYQYPPLEHNLFEHNRLQRSQSSMYPPPVNPSSFHGTSSFYPSPSGHQDAHPGHSMEGRHPYHRSYSDSPHNLRQAGEAYDRAIDLNLSLGSGDGSYQSSDLGVQHHVQGHLPRDIPMSGPFATNPRAVQEYGDYQREAQTGYPGFFNHEHLHHNMPMEVSEPNTSSLPHESSGPEANTDGSAEDTIPQQTNAAGREPPDEEVEQFFTMFRRMKQADNYLKNKDMDLSNKRRRRRHPRDPGGGKDGGGGSNPDGSVGI